MRVQHALSARLGRVVLIAETTILFSTQAEVVRYRKRLASQAKDSALGVNVTTPSALVEELWEVWGSGEALVSAHQRSLIIKQLLAEQSDWVDSAGTVELLARFVGDWGGYVDADLCALHKADLTASDEEIIAFVNRYTEALFQAGLIEPACALDQIRSSVRLGTVIVRTQDELPAYFRDFLGETACVVREEDAQISLFEVDEDDHERDILLLKPAGPSASAFLIDQAIRTAPTCHKTIITAPDPRVPFGLMKEGLLAQGCVITLEAKLAFRDTLFGRAYGAVASLLEGERSSHVRLLEAAQVYLASPYAQVPPAQAQRIESAIRSDRALDPSRICNSIASASRTFELFETLFEDIESGMVLSYFEDLLQRLRLDAAKKATEFSILARLKELYYDSQALGVLPCDVAVLADQLSAPFATMLAPEDACLSEQDAEGVSCVPFCEEARNGAKHILFTTFEAAAALPKACCDQVILTSLDSEHYRGNAHRSTLTSFLERFDLPYEDTALISLERRFERVCALARKSVVFEYAKQDRNGEACYPAFFLETFLNECAREGRDVVLREIGEESFDCTARLFAESPAELLLEAPLARGELNSEDRARLLTYRRDSTGKERLVVSPSALETYRSCPYKWFVQRKLRLNDEGEEFGPREMGLFVHSVFQRFYGLWAQQGHARITHETLQEACELFTVVFDDLLEQQATVKPGDRLIAVNELERQELEQLKSKLLANLAYQQDIFREFHVRDHEYVIPVEDEVIYGGAIINGRVDRIDADDKGNFIVIDYKGSLARYPAAGYDPDAAGEGEPFESPEKIQTLVYAQALRRKEGLHPKAALYLSYSAKDERSLMRGSLAQTLVESETISRSSCVKGSFEGYLDLVEADIARTIERMERGDIAPDPRTKDACTYCPVLYCEKRAHGSH